MLHEEGLPFDGWYMMTLSLLGLYDDKTTHQNHSMR